MAIQQSRLKLIYQLEVTFCTNDTFLEIAGVTPGIIPLSR